MLVPCAEMRTISKCHAFKQAHIDGCTYIGPGGLRFAETLAQLGGKVSVPTTLNANSVDRRRWHVINILGQKFSLFIKRVFKMMLMGLALLVSIYTDNSFNVDDLM